MRQRILKIDGEDAGRSVHDLMKNELCISESFISRLKRRASGIRIDGEKAYTTRRVSVGETLTVEVGDPEDFPRPEPMPHPLSILYEDEDYILIDKEAGISVHASTRNPGELTLENALAAYLPPGENPHPVSRLDRGTTGVITFAKSGYAHELLRRQNHTKNYFREYRGLALGMLYPEKGIIDAPIGLLDGSTYQRAVCAGGAPALTEYETLATDGARSFLRLLPQTGRTHQLRVHLASIGHPLCGDWLYGTEDRGLIARPALHSYRLIWKHPLTGRRIEITAPLPEDMRNLLCSFKMLP